MGQGAVSAFSAASEALHRWKRTCSTVSIAFGIVLKLVSRIE